MKDKFSSKLSVKRIVRIQKVAPVVVSKTQTLRLIAKGVAQISLTHKNINLVPDLARIAERVFFTPHRSASTAESF